IAGEPMEWPALCRALADANQLVSWIRDPQRPISTALLHRALRFARERREAEGERPSLSAADWRARWAYHLRRAFPDAHRDAERLRFFDRLLGSGLAQATGSGGPGAV